eukprot:g5916.t1
MSSPGMSSVCVVFALLDGGWPALCDIPVVPNGCWCVWGTSVEQLMMFGVGQESSICMLATSVTDVTRSRCPDTLAPDAGRDRGTGR